MLTVSCPLRRGSAPDNSRGWPTNGSGRGCRGGGGSPVIRSADGPCRCEVGAPRTDLDEEWPLRHGAELPGLLVPQNPKLQEFRRFLESETSAKDEISGIRPMFQQHLRVPTCLSKDTSTGHFVPLYFGPPTSFRSPSLFCRPPRRLGTLTPEQDPRIAANWKPTKARKLDSRKIALRGCGGNRLTNRPTTALNNR